MEACVKAVGARLTDGLSLPVAAAGPVRAESGPLAGTCWFVRDVTGPPGYAAAVALAAEADFTTRVRWWTWPAGPVDPPTPTCDPL